jgi:hypothetical protein
VEVDGMIQDQETIINYLTKSFNFGSLFILARPDAEQRFVAEIKNINDGLDQISFVSLNEEGLPFKEGESLELINESGNISFQMVVLKNHGTKWLTGELPNAMKMINLRQCPRISPRPEHLLRKSSVTSYGEEGRQKGASFEAEVIDISDTGASLLIRARRLDGLFRADSVEMNLSKRHSFLSRIRGEVVHKSVAYSSDKDQRFYKVGVKFDSRQDISALHS